VWDLGRCSLWSSKDRVLGYVSPSKHLYRPHVADGVDKQVISYDLFIHQTGKEVASVENVWDIDWHLLEPFM
jgi:hypothetical protein